MAAESALAALDWPGAGAAQAGIRRTNEMTGAAKKDGKRKVPSAPKIKVEQTTLLFAAQSYATSTFTGIFSSFEQGRASRGAEQI